MSFVADEVVKWREDPPWFDRIDMDELGRPVSVMSRNRLQCITMFRKRILSGISTL